MKINREDCVFSLICEPEFTPIEGNAIPSGDPEVDAECERDIRAQLDAGNVWAWCSVTVTCSYIGQDGDTHEGSDNLGCCSCTSAASFMQGYYYSDMCDVAFAALESKLLPEPEPEHYVYGSGMVGCLYDNGPNHAATAADAIDDLCRTFDDLSESYLEGMRADLERDGIHHFSEEPQDWSDLGLCHEGETTTARAVAGADYCEVSGPYFGASETDGE